MTGSPPRRRGPTSADCAPAFKPARIVQVELGEPLSSVSSFDPRTGRSYERAMSLVRLHTQPLGVVELELPGHQLSAGDYACRISSALGPQIAEHLRQDCLPVARELTTAGLPSPGMPRCLESRDRILANAPFASIVVATRDRPDSLAICLRSLLSLEYPSYEIIVVDNAPSSNATAELLRRQYGHLPQVHYVREDWPGLSSARNRGLQAANGEIIAITDDDVIADPQWLTQLVAGFHCADNVACVTGMIFPIELETPAQIWIEQYWGLSKGFARRTFDMTENRVIDPLYPYNAGMFGSGANIAFKASILRKIGGFDPALGAGSKALGGEDLAIFFQIITEGYRIVYEPAAIINHLHRRDHSGLRSQTYGYGVGLTAYLTKILWDKPELIFGLLARMPYGLLFALSPRSKKNRRKTATYPRDLIYLELMGMLNGPFAYVRSRWNTRPKATCRPAPASTGQSGPARDLA